MTTSIEEKRIWDEKAGKDVRYEVWNENDLVKWEIDADKCTAIIMAELVGCNELLEIGCGIGRLSCRVCKDYEVDRVVGVDISQGMIDRAYRHSKVRYIVNDGRSLPVLGGSVDGVYSMITLQHIETEGVKGYIKEAGRVLRDGGKFVFQYVEGNTSGPLSYCYKVHDVIKWCRVAGLDVIDVREGLVYDEWTWITAVKVER